MRTVDSLEKSLMLGMIEGRRRGVAGWHHQNNGHELEQSLGASEGQGGLVCCSQWSCKELDMIR